MLVRYLFRLHVGVYRGFYGILVRRGDEKSGERKKRGGACLLTWCERGIEHVDVDADVHGTGADAVADARDDAGRPEAVEVPGRQAREAAALVVADVAAGPH